MQNEEQIRKFVQSLEVIASEDTDYEGDGARYDIIVRLPDKTQVIKTQWTCGPGFFKDWSKNRFDKRPILESLFFDAESYLDLPDDGDEADRIAWFLSEFGYDEDRKSLAEGFRVYKGCKNTAAKITRLIAFYCAWRDKPGFRDSPGAYVREILEYLENAPEADVMPVLQVEYISDYESKEDK